MVLEKFGELKNGKWWSEWGKLSDEEKATYRERARNIKPEVGPATIEMKGKQKALIKKLNVLVSLSILKIVFKNLS